MATFRNCPRREVAAASFGLRTNQFGFTVAWASGTVVMVEACADLANPTWPPVATNTLTSGSFYVSDPQWTKYPARFYRLHSPGAGAVTLLSTVATLLTARSRELNMSMATKATRKRYEGKN
jgi:hypothetical protein